jgi:hypothetical protein
MVPLTIMSPSIRQPRQLHPPPSIALVRHRLTNRARRAALPELLAKEFPGQRFAGKASPYRASPHPFVVGIPCFSIGTATSPGRFLRRVYVQSAAGDAGGATGAAFAVWQALGGARFVCDPRRADIEAILNAKIKRRESFGPFAPSVLEDAVADWFETGLEQRGFAAVEHGDLVFVLIARIGKAGARHQPDIAAADHSDAHVAPFLHS